MLRRIPVPHRVLATVLVGSFLLWQSLGKTSVDANERSNVGIYAKQNLVAWCIVPFDAANRGPRQRAQMLTDLGLTKVAYDWRQQHVETFEDEILAYKHHGLEFFAFWDVHETMFELFEKYEISPQVWKMMPEPAAETQQDKVAAAGRQLLPLVERTRNLGCQLGIYNHGGWAGDPRNMVDVCRWLRENADGKHVGIVYNFHHGHEHIDEFPNHLALMKPYLLCVNLNGMNDGANPKILPLGKGKHEVAMMRVLQASGYDGPIGILDHRSEMDAKQSLSENLDGMKKVLTELPDRTALETYD